MIFLMSAMAFAQPEHPPLVRLKGIVLESRSPETLALLARASACEAPSLPPGAMLVGALEALSDHPGLRYTSTPIALIQIDREAKIEIPYEEGRYSWSMKPFEREDGALWMEHHFSLPTRNVWMNAVVPLEVGESWSASNGQWFIALTRLSEHEQFQQHAEWAKATFDQKSWRARKRTLERLLGACT